MASPAITASSSLANYPSINNEIEQYYWRIRCLLRNHDQTQILAVSPSIIGGFSTNSWRNLRAAVERLVYDEGLVLSHATAGDNTTLLLQPTERALTYDPQLPPTSPWHSRTNPCLREREPQLGVDHTASMSYTTAQLQYLERIHTCMALRPEGDKRVICIDPYAIKTDSPSPVQDVCKMLRYMVTEGSIVAFASEENNRFLIMASSEDTIDRQQEDSLTSDWISKANPTATEIQGPLISYSCKLNGERLVVSLDSFYQILFKEMQGELNPIPQLKSPGDDLVALLPQIAVLPSLKDENVIALLYALVHADEGWYRETLPRLHPTCLKGLVEIALVMKPKWLLTTRLFERMMPYLTQLPSDHRHVRAFLRGFPSVENMERGFSGLDYGARKKKALDAVNRQESEGRCGHYCLKFVQTSSFIHFFNHLSDADRRVFLRNVFAFAGRFFVGLFLEAPSDRTESEVWNDLLSVADRFDIPYARQILEGLSYSLDIDKVTQVCLHRGADGSLISQILNRNPYDTYEAYGYKIEDPFFTNFLHELGKSTSPEVHTVLEWVTESIFSGTENQRTEALLTELIVSHLPFLAQHFHRLPPSVQAKIEAETCLKLTNELVQRPSVDAEANLRAIGSVLANSSRLLPSDSAYQQALQKLYSLGNEALQIRIILNFLHHWSLSQPSESQTLFAFLLQLPSASRAVWEQVGERWSLPTYALRMDAVDAFLQSLPADSLVGFINGLVKKPHISQVSNEVDFVTAAYMQLLQPGKADATHLAHLSDQALAWFPITVSHKGRWGYGEAADSLWYRVVVVLQQVKTAEESRLLTALSKRILDGNSAFYNTRTLDYFAALTDLQVCQIPQDQFQRGMQFFFAYFRNSLDRDCAALRAIAQSLTEEECRAVVSLMILLNQKNRGSIHSFITTLYDPQVPSVLLQTILDQMLEKCSTDEFLRLPPPLLADNLPKVTSLEKRIELLNGFMEAEMRQALEIWWPSFRWEQEREMIVRGFPFARVIRFLEDPAQIAPVAGIPAGTTYAPQLLPIGSDFASVLRGVLGAFEANPWKLWLVLDGLNLDALSDCEGVASDLRGRFPNFYSILDWYYDRAKKTTKRAELQAMEQQMTAAIEGKRWQEAWDGLNSMDENSKNYFLAILRGASSRYLAQAGFTSFQLFAAIFDPVASQNLKFTSLAILSQAASLRQEIASSSLPEEVKQRIAFGPS